MDIVQFIRFKRRDGSYTDWAAQNFYIGQSISYGGVSHQFLPVAVAAGAATSGGNRSEAAIGAPADVLTLNVFSEAAESNWLVEVKTVKVNRVDLSLGALLQSELWACQRVQHEDSEPVAKLQLSSPLDAVRGVGGRALSQELVGALPVSGTLSLR